MAGKTGKKGLAVALVLIVSLVGAGNASPMNGEWEEVSGGISRSERILCVKGIDSTDVVYAGTDSSLYRTNDSGKTWAVESLPGGKVRVNDIAFSDENVFIAAGDGLYRGTAGGSWEYIPGKSDLKGVIKVGEKNGTVLVWTSHEIFMVGKNSWKRVGRGTPWDKIEDSAFRDGVIYVASDGKVFYSSDKGDTWEKYFLAMDMLNDETGMSAGEDAPEDLPVIRKMDFTGSHGITVATKYGVFIIKDADGALKRIDTTGLPASSVTYALNAGEGLFAATNNKVFLYFSEEYLWRSFFEDAASGIITYLRVVKDEKGRGWLWVAAERNMYRRNIDFLPRIAGDKNSEKSGKINEVSIMEVQRMAVEYAEVSPEKIKRWRTGAQWNALLPRLSLGFSEGWNDNIDIYKSATRSYVITGPRERDTDWGVDLTWELSELIWNGAQTIIDVRSKLMVQLRDDILEEVTRLYFERKRLLAELGTLGHIGGRAPLEKRLRIEELTAYIDALTGGRYSEEIEQRREVALGDK